MKFNIELIYLPDEMYKNSKQTFTITFGKPIPPGRCLTSPKHLLSGHNM